MGSGSLNVMVANDFEELELVYRIQNKKIDTTNCLTGFVYQEMLNGVEYGMDILNDFNGNYIGSFARKKLSMRCGETDKAISVIDENFELIAKKIGESTKHIGSVDCDFFVSNDEIYFLEINPRFGGGYPFSHEAGINIPAIYNSWLRNDGIKEYLSEYKDGIMFSKCSKIVRLQSRIKSPLISSFFNVFKYQVFK